MFKFKITPNPEFEDFEFHLCVFNGNQGNGPEFTLLYDKEKARYVRTNAHNIGICTDIEYTKKIYKKILKIQDG